MITPKKNQEPISREMMFECFPCQPIPAFLAHCFSEIGPVSTYNFDIESGCIYAGVPAKKVKSIDPEQVRVLIEGIANNYTMYSEWFKED